MQINIERLRSIANDKRPARAPYVGIPLVNRNGELMCIAVRRDHLRAAVTLAVAVKWDAGASFETGSDLYNRRDTYHKPCLVLSGGKSCYKLVDQSPNLWVIRGELEAWARAQRKSLIRKSATLAERKAAAIDKKIGVLQRKLAKVYARRPVNPLCRRPRGDYQEHNYYRDSEAKWAEGKRIRRELARVFTGPALASLEFNKRLDWKKLYAAAAKALGVESIDESKCHVRMTKFTRGPWLSITEYVRHPEIHLARMWKPYRTRVCDWEEGGSPEYGSFAKQMHARRLAYLEELPGKRALESQIANLEEVKRGILESEVQP